MITAIVQSEHLLKAKYRCAAFLWTYSILEKTKVPSRLKGIGCCSNTPIMYNLLCTRAGKIKPKNLQVWFLSVFVRKTNIWGWIWIKSGMLSFIYHNRNLFSRFSSWGCWGRPLSTAFTVWRKTIAESKQKVQPPAAIIKIVTAKPCKQCLSPNVGNLTEEIFSSVYILVRTSREEKLGSL